MTELALRAQRSLVYKPSLPLHVVDAWDLTFVLDDGLRVTAIEARGGMVVAGGSDVHLLRPGAALWGIHSLPEDFGPVRVVAVEPRAERRHALASEDKFLIFVKGEGDAIVGLTSKTEGSRVTHLVWGGTEGPSTLYVLRDDRVLRRMKPDQSVFEAMDYEPLHALAADERGAVAMLSLAHPQRVYVSPDGVAMDERRIDPELAPGASVQMVLADTAVALVVDGRYVLLSRAEGDPFVRVPALDLGELEHGFRLGPVAFHGTSGDAALIGARKEGDLARVVRVDASGAAMSLLEVEGTEIRDAPDIVSLSWDSSRQTLWGASSDAGIFRLSPPEAKGKKRVVLS